MLPPPLAYVMNVYSPGHSATLEDWGTLRSLGGGSLAG